MSTFTTRPVIMGTHGIISAGHYLATAAGLRILQAGGNAVDAGVAAGFCLQVVEPQQNGAAGEAPILIYSAQHKKAFSINGHGTAPKRATIEWFREQGIDLIPGDGFLPAVVPAAFDAYVTALKEFGTMTLAQVLSPAIDLAEFGFPMYGHLRRALNTNAERFRREWPTSAHVFLSNGRIHEVGDIFRQPLWAGTFNRVIEVERESSHLGRNAALEAARDFFYKGEIAERIAGYVQNTEITDSTGKAHKGLLTYEDMAGYHAKIEEPVVTNYRGIDVLKCGPWCQGPVFLQQLNLLEGFNLAEMGHNSADYIHTLVEAAKLAFADREAYYGDPEFDDVPMDILLSKEYSDERRALIGTEASADLRPGEINGPLPYDVSSARLDPVGNHANDTTHLNVIDAQGNMISAMPSGGWLSSSPVVEGIGFPIGTRGQMFFLDPRRPNALEPGKRPRTTLTPGLALKDGKPWMAFGTPGGDMQDQWALQFLLNVVDFGMNLQEAADAASFHTSHFPSSFYPRTMYPKRVVVEERIPEEVRNELEARGHNVRTVGPWNNGRLLAVTIEGETIMGAASPRLETGYAAGW